LLETWPTPEPGPLSPAGVARPEPVPGPSDEPTSDLATPPLGIEKPVVVEPLASRSQEGGTPAAADVAADTDSLLVPADALVPADHDPVLETPDAPAVESAPAADVAADTDSLLMPDSPADPGPASATPPGPAGQALFSPPGVNGTSPVEPPPARPSPTPRPRPAASTAGNRYGPGSASPLPDGSAPGPEYTIKGNAGSMLFHRPDSPYYARTKAEVWFRTATDARAAGFTEWVPRSRTSS
jgi:hypothetical protein